MQKHGTKLRCEVSPVPWNYAWAIFWPSLPPLSRLCPCVFRKITVIRCRVCVLTLLTEELVWRHSMLAGSHWFYAKLCVRLTVCFCSSELVPMWSVIWSPFVHFPRTRTDSGDNIEMPFYALKSFSSLQLAPCTFRKVSQLGATTMHSLYHSNIYSILKKLSEAWRLKNVHPWLLPYKINM